MWRCARCKFLYIVRESPDRCEVCHGDRFIKILIADKAGTGQRSA